MKTIELSQTPPDVADLFQQARDEDIVIRLADGSGFLLMAFEDLDQEVARSRNNPELMAYLEARARQPATIPLDEVQRRLGL